MNKLIKNILTKITLVFLVLIFVQDIFSQSLKVDNDTINKKRLNTVIYTSVGISAISLTALYYGWYKDTPLTGFHFINDNQNTLQIDKVGHTASTYTLSYWSFSSLRWAGVDNNKSAIYGSMMGFGSMLVLEFLDGFSSEYGASWGDLIANGIGSAMFLSQQLGWKEQRFRLKFSYHPTDYAQYNPALLGKNSLQSLLKDYNGHTYWLSANIHSFLNEESKFPKWINVAVGYGGKGILGVTSNPSEVDGHPVPHYERVRQYYVSMDIDWTKIETNSKFLRFTFKTLSFIKLPFPTLEYNKENDFVFHWLYF